jgi:hypothetical protein
MIPKPKDDKLSKESQKKSSAGIHARKIYLNIFSGIKICLMYR